MSNEKSERNLVEETTQDGYMIVREPGMDMLLWAYYVSYNKRCFDGSLPEMPVFWGKTIARGNERHVHALYVYEDPRRYIVLNETLQGMEPFDRLCLLHEMIHVKIDPISGHGAEFIAELKRVLDAAQWDVMGCID
jgi:hypothetical protein